MAYILRRGRPKGGYLQIRWLIQASSWHHSYFIHTLFMLYLCFFHTGTMTKALIEQGTDQGPICHFLIKIAYAVKKRPGLTENPAMGRGNKDYLFNFLNSPCYNNTLNLKLSELALHQPAIVLAVHGDDLSLKLFEMGLLPGEEVALENIAPFGDPIAVKVGEYKMCLRLSDAACIDVKLK
jgi:ferrous iron transport protein A